MKNIFRRMLIAVLIVQCSFLSELPAATKNFTSTASSLYHEASNAQRMRRFTLAKKTFRELIEKYPDDGFADMARNSLAYLLRDLNEYEEAIEMFKAIIATSDNALEVVKAKKELADLLYEKHRYREGIELLETWLEKEPKHSDYARKLASFYMQSGQKDEAWLLLEKFVERGNEEAFKDLLGLAARSGEIDRLLSNLESHRTRYRSNVYSSFIADCFLALGRKDKAIEALKENENYSKDTILLRKLSDIQISLGLTDEAIETLEKLFAYLPTDFQCARKLGHCYFLKGNKSKAMSVWKKPVIARQDKQQVYMEYTSILIEHQLLEEALNAFDEAREVMYAHTAFAEEKAAVLESLGRNQEAMEEYLKVLSSGIYKAEIFDKLYKSEVKGFDLEERLNSLNFDSFNTAAVQALLELYFRKGKSSYVEKIVSVICNQDDPYFDDLFFSRLRQEAVLIPERFHLELAKRMMTARKDRALEAKLAVLLLRMPEYNEEWQTEAYEASRKVVHSGFLYDMSFKYDLCLKLAEFALETRHSLPEADEYVSMVLKPNTILPSQRQNIEAKLLRARIRLYASDFKVSKETLDEVNAMLNSYKLYGSSSLLERDNFIMKEKLERARLLAHKGDYQEALNSIKSIVEEHKEGEFVNDAIELALDITRYSIGDFSFMAHKLASERFAASGESSKAIEELDAGIKSLPASSTVLIDEMEAERLLLSGGIISNKALIESIEKFVDAKPDCSRNVELCEFKIKLMQRMKLAKDRIDEAMRDFINRFPNDLRSGKYKKTLENTESGGK